MPETDTTATAVTLFYSYAHEDEPLRDELAGHLKILERRGLIRAWHDRKIVAGQDWAQAIDRNLDGADLVLLLVSKDFIESDYCFGVELQRAMERQATQACDVVPIFVRAVDVAPEDAVDFPFLKLQGLPTDLKAVTSWTNRDEAWTNVAKGLRAAVSGIRARRPAPVTPVAPEAVAAPAALSPTLEAVTPRPAAPVVRSPQPVPPVFPPPLPAAMRVPAAAAEKPPLQADPTLDGIISGVMKQLDEADAQRIGSPMVGDARHKAWLGTCALIDVPDQKRILWVDDQPDGNRHEMAVLARLQIEVVAVRSTAEALQRVADDSRAGEDFDLVLTDWSRPADGPDAALTLMARLREAGHQLPVVVYHGEFDTARRAARAAQGVAAGAMGEAVLPSELIQLVEKALSGA